MVLVEWLNSRYNLLSRREIAEKKLGREPVTTFVGVDPILWLSSGLWLGGSVVRASNSQLGGYKFES